MNEECMCKDKVEPTRAGFDTKRVDLTLGSSAQEIKRSLTEHYAFHMVGPGDVIISRSGEAELISR